MSVDVGDLIGTIAIQDQVSDVLTRVTERVKRFAEEFDGAFGAAAIGVGVLVAAVGGAITSIVELGNKGSVILGVETAFDRLAVAAGTTGDALREGLNKGVKETISEFELMQTTSKLLSSGMKLTADQALLMGQTARELGKATGTDAAQGLATLSQALLTGRTRALAMAGIVVDVKDAETKFAASLGVTVNQLSAAGLLEAKRTAILTAMQAQVDRLGISELSFKERILQAEEAIGEWVNTLEKTIAASPNVMRAMDAIGKAITDAFGGVGKTALEVIVGWVNKFADAVTKYGPPIIQTVANIAQGVVDVWHRVQEAWDLVPDWFKKIAADAALASAAVYLVGEATGHASGSDVLAALGNLAQIWSVIGINITKAAAAAKEWVLIIAAFKLEGLTLALSSLGAAMAAFAASPLGIAIALTATGVAAYNATGFIGDLYNRWKESKPMWDAFKQGGSFWDNSIIGRMLGMSKTGESGNLPSTTLAMNQVGLIKPSAEAGKGADISSFIKGPDLAKIEAATTASISKTEGLWDEYASLVEKNMGDVLASQLSSIARWENGQLAALEKTKKYNQNYANEQAAIWAVALEKTLDAQKAYADRVLKINTDQRMTLDAEFKKQEESKAAIAEAGHMSVYNAQLAYDNLVRQNTLSTTDYQIEQVKAWEEAELNAFKGTAEQFLEFQRIIRSQSALKIDALFFDSATLRDKNNANLQAIADKAFTTYDMMKADSANYSEQAIQDQLDLGNAAQQTALGVKDAWSKALSGIADMFAKIGQAAGGSAGQIIGSMGQVAVALDTVMHSGKKQVNGQWVEMSDQEKSTQNKLTLATGVIGGAAMGLNADTTQGFNNAMITGMGLDSQHLGQTVALGVATFGISVGVSAIVSTLKYLFRDRTVEDIARDAGKDFGTALSQGTTDAIKGMVKSGFSFQAAELANLSSIIKDAGGLTDKNLDKLTARLHDVFSMIETGQLNIAQGSKIIDDNWAAFAQAGTDVNGFLSQALVTITQLDQKFGTNSQAIKDYMKGQAGNALTALNDVVAGTSLAVAGWDAVKAAVDAATNATTKDDIALRKALDAQKIAADGAKTELNNLGFLAVTTFNAAVKAGMSIPDAIKAAQPALDTLAKGFKDLGLNIDDVTVKALLMQSSVFSAHPELGQGLSGLMGLLPALSNMSALTPAAFSSVEQAGRQQFVRVQSAVEQQGGTNTDALLIMQPFLHQADEAARILGTHVDDFTKMLEDQSRQAGIWQDAAKTEQQILGDHMVDLQNAVDNNTAALLGLPAPNPNPTAPTTPTTTAPPPEGQTPRNNTNNPAPPVIFNVSVPPGTSPDDTQAFARTGLRAMRDDTLGFLTAIQIVADRRIEQSP